MADKLRELFDEMVSDEPPLRTTADAAAAAGRRLVVRRRTLWTTASAALAVALVAAVPTLATTGRSAISSAASTSGTRSATPSAIPSVTPSGPAVATPSPSADARVVQFRHCPTPTIYPSADTADGSILPNVDRAAAAVAVAGPGIAPGKQFILRVHSYIATSEKSKNRPQVALILDVGDDQGFGFLSFQIYTELGPTPAQWADWLINAENGCVDVQRRDFADGSIAISIQPGSPIQAARSTQVYYFSAQGYTMNIGCYNEGWSTSGDPNIPPPPPPLPVRTNVPLTVSQIMALADVIAHI